MYGEISLPEVQLRSGIISLGMTSSMLRGAPGVFRIKPLSSSFFNHAMTRWRASPKVLLEVGLRWRLPMYLCVVVYE